jgi:hypothetical protein
MKKAHLMALAALFACLPATRLLADPDDGPTSRAVGTELFGTLDNRSKYYTDAFPEPFRVDDTAINNEFRLDWEHDSGSGSRSNVETAEVQKSFDIFTFQIQAPYEDVHGSGGGEDGAGGTQGGSGFGNVELAARMPLLQYVSAGGAIDNTVGVNFALGIPTRSTLSKSTTLGPGLFDDLALGKHFTVQSLFSVTRSFGATDGGKASFEYGMAFGYSMEDEDLPIPGVERLTPSVELVGETALDGSNSGHNALTGTAGLRAELKAIGDLQPSVGLGYVFPIDTGGRDEIHWGIILSVTVDF